jgi:hypothetical protein
LRRSAGAALTMAKGNEEHTSENKRPCVYNGWEEHISNSAEQGEHEQHAYVTEARTPVGDTKGMIGRSQPFFSSRGTSSREPWWVETSQKSNICTLFCSLQDTILHKGGNGGCSVWLATCKSNVVWLPQNPLIW